MSRGGVETVTRAEKRREAVDLKVAGQTARDQSRRVATNQVTHKPHLHRGACLKGQRHEKTLCRHALLLHAPPHFFKEKRSCAAC